MEYARHSFLTKFVGLILVLLLSSCAVISQNDKPKDGGARSVTFAVSKTLFTDRLRIQVESGSYLTSHATTEYTDANTKANVEALKYNYQSVSEGYESTSVLPAYRAPDQLIYVPQKTSYDYSLTSSTLNLSFAVLHKKRFELWLSAGAAYHQFDLDAKLFGPIDVYANTLPVPADHSAYLVKYVLQEHQTENLSFGESISKVLPYIRFESTYKINSLFSVSASISDSMNPWSVNSALSVNEEQCRFTYSPKDYLDLHLGYKYTRVYVEDTDEKRNFDKELHLNGFVGGIALRF